MDYRSRKEAFHSGNAGTSLLHLHSVTLVGLTTFHLWSSLPRTPLICRWQFAAEYTIFVVPLVLATTVLSDHLFSLNLILACFSICIKAVQRDAQYTAPASAIPSRTQSALSRLAYKQTFITVYRAQMMIITVICILAVDFPAFPRGFGKCETEGTSLMDVGVGSFVYAHGFVSASRLLKQTYGPPSTIGNVARASLARSLGVLTLGVARLVTVKGVGYPEQIQEYGVHWNFFFTLAVVPLLGIFVPTGRPRLPLWMMALLFSLSTILLMRAKEHRLAHVGSVHQLALSYRLTRWVIEVPRTSLLTANKEGIASLPGFMALFLVGLDAGIACMDSEQFPAWQFQSKKPARKTFAILKGLVFRAFSGWSALAVVQYTCHINVSRQTANLAYVLWVAAFNSSHLLCCRLIQLYVYHDVAPALLSAVNQNGLVIFLVANAMTGVVNMCMDTLCTGDVMTVTVMTCYTAVVSAVAWNLRSKTLRFYFVHCQSRQTFDFGDIH